MGSCARSARLTLASLLLATAAAATAASDPHSAAERAIHYRHSVYHVIEWNVAAMADMVKGKTAFDPAQFSMRAGRVAALAPMLLEGFPPDSYVAGHTLAKPTVFSDRAEFEQLLRKLGARSDALARAAGSGELSTIRPAFDELVGTCKECHKRFKERGGHSAF